MQQAICVHASLPAPVACLCIEVENKISLAKESRARHVGEAVEGSTGRRGARLNTGAKLHHCTYCSYSTYRKDHLKIHIRTHTGERPYGCPHCPSRFVQTNALRKHLMIHSRDRSSLHRCTLCPFSTSRKDALILHLCTHAEDKSLLCKFCNVQFSDSNVFQAHIRTHAQERPLTLDERLLVPNSMGSSLGAEEWCSTRASPPTDGTSALIAHTLQPEKSLTVYT
ncbi:Zinc finger protein 64, isoforms 1 and 2 [Portunus trituberculatus]|uniref:Zinc finger protein 64, isoforms 1 and 2 n=1 Tax=Portunus trituberculatus TaxID=210409 RepID=A0A5B7D9S3_PORTR|nr:Zinc finger protein 64, isoforms 1 and 2 [Portunus trituberculatus]